MGSSVNFKLLDRILTCTQSSSPRELNSSHQSIPVTHTHTRRQERERGRNTGRSNSTIDRLVHSLHLSSRMEGVIHKCSFTFSIIHLVHSSDSLLSSSTYSILGLYHLQVRDLAPSSGDHTDCNRVPVQEKESPHGFNYANR